MTLSPLTAAEPRLHKSPRLKPFTVRRHDMWHPSASRTAAAHLPQPQPIDRPSLISLLPALAWPFRAIALAWRRQGEARDLNGLDDHLLRDMGLTRAEIGAALRKGRHPHPDRPE